jgi:hypothetical protein
VVQSIADALKVSAETLYERAGVTPNGDEGSETAIAIKKDPRLTARQRRAMLEIYQSFTGISATPRRRRRNSADPASE